MAWSTNKVAVATASVVVATALTGCTGSVEASPRVSPCSPSYTAPSNYGRFTAQQASRGKAIQWGAYPKAAYQGTNYRVAVYAGGVKVDSKNQSYAPHGSLGAAKAAKYSGKEFRLVGTVHRDGKLVLGFDLRCTIA